MFRQALFDLGTLSFRRRRQAFRIGGNAIPKIRCELYALCRTELEKFIQPYRHLLPLQVPCSSKILTESPGLSKPHTVRLACV